MDAKKVDERTLAKGDPRNLLLASFVLYSQFRQCGCEVAEDAHGQRRQRVGIQPPVVGVNVGGNGGVKSRVLGGRVVVTGPTNLTAESLAQPNQTHYSPLLGQVWLSRKVYSPVSSRVGIYCYQLGTNGVINTTHNTSRLVKPSKTPTAMPASLSEFTPIDLVDHGVAVAGSG